MNDTKIDNIIENLAVIMPIFHRKNFSSYHTRAYRYVRSLGDLEEDSN
jgi:hypothetical protein